MKFPEDVYFSIKYMYFQNFSNCHALFVFLSHSVAVAAWSQMIHFELFYHLVRRSKFNPQAMFV